MLQKRNVSLFRRMMHDDQISAHSRQGHFGDLFQCDPPPELQRVHAAPSQYVERAGGEHDRPRLALVAPIELMCIITEYNLFALSSLHSICSRYLALGRNQVCNGARVTKLEIIASETAGEKGEEIVRDWRESGAVRSIGLEQNKTGAARLGIVLLMLVGLNQRRLLLLFQLLQSRFHFFHLVRKVFLLILVLL